MQKNHWAKLTALLLLTSVAISGCNTVKGMGEDVQRGGEKVAQTADQVQQKM